MGQIFDEADYRRRLDALDSSNITMGQEASDIWAGWKGLMNPLVFDSSKIGSGPLDARKSILAAKQDALRRTRKKMIQAIRAEEDKALQNNVLPTEVEQIVTGNSDVLIKV